VYSHFTESIIQANHRRLARFELKENINEVPITIVEARPEDSYLSLSNKRNYQHSLINQCGLMIHPKPWNVLSAYTISGKRRMPHVAHTMWALLS
jgi:hypothetical protein